MSYDMDLYGLADVMRLNRHMDIELNANVDFETLLPILIKTCSVLAGS
ncbi:MAG: hypothetical protein R2865_03170 [Deinococcales bacterium]